MKIEKPLYLYKKLYLKTLSTAKQSSSESTSQDEASPDTANAPPTEAAPAENGNDSPGMVNGQTEAGEGAGAGHEEPTAMEAEDSKAEDMPVLIEVFLACSYHILF